MVKTITLGEKIQTNVKAKKKSKQENIFYKIQEKNMVKLISLGRKKTHAKDKNKKVRKIFLHSQEKRYGDNH